MMPLAPMAQELARRIRQTTSFLHMNYIHLHLHSFVSWYKFTYLDPAWSEPTGTDMIDRHRAIILASGSLRNVFTCRIINNKNIQRTALLRKLSYRITKPFSTSFSLDFSVRRHLLNCLGECFWHTLLITRAYHVKNLTQKKQCFCTPFQPTGKGKRTCLPRIYKRKPWFLRCDNGVTILPGSLPVSPG